MITDPVGNTLDGDGNGTGGDAYQQVFDVVRAGGPGVRGRHEQQLGLAAD